MPYENAFEFELATENIKSYKSPGIDQVPAELIKGGGRTFRSVIHKLANYIWNKEELLEKWKKSIILPIFKTGDKTECVIIETYHFLPTT